MSVTFNVVDPDVCTPLEIKHTFSVVGQKDMSESFINPFDS